MTEHLFRELYKYKFKTEKRDRKLLMELVRSTESALKVNATPELKLFAAHMLIEVRDSILGSHMTGYNGSFGKEDEQLRIEAFQLLPFLPSGTGNALQLLIEKLSFSESETKMKDVSVIRFCIPWEFYLVESKYEKVLHIVTQVNGFKEHVYDLDTYYCETLNRSKNPDEIIYNIINPIRVKKFLELSGKT